MPRMSPTKRIAHALSKVNQGQRLIREGEKELRQALKSLSMDRKAEASVTDGN